MGAIIIINIIIHQSQQIHKTFFIQDSNKPSREHRTHIPPPPLLYSAIHPSPTIIMSATIHQTYSHHHHRLFLVVMAMTSMMMMNIHTLQFTMTCHAFTTPSPKLLVVRTFFITIYIHTYIFFLLVVVCFTDFPFAFLF